MKLTRESPRYNKIQIRSDQAKRWARLRGEHPRPAPQSSEAAEHIAGFFDVDKDKSDLKRAGIGALLVHFLVFFLVIPERAPEIVPIERTAATVVKRYTPPSPPAKARKTPKKKKSRPLPIPDPTPDEPEPVELQESDADFGEFDAEFAIGLPDGVPGISSLRGQAFRAGEGGIASPIVIRQIDPEYTPEATRRGIQGEVWIEAVVDVNGQVVEPRLLRGLPDDELNRRAMEAIQRWEFRPGMKDGQPVPVLAVFTVTYRLH